MRVWLTLPSLRTDSFQSLSLSPQPKGADRKHKTDRDKVERRTNSDRDSYKPSCDVTWLMDVPVQPQTGAASASAEVPAPPAVPVPSTTPGGPALTTPSPRPLGANDFGQGGLLHASSVPTQLRSPPARSDVSKETNNSCSTGSECGVA